MRTRRCLFSIFYLLLLCGHGASGVVIGVVGDFGSGTSNELAVANLIKSWNPDFIMTVGDNNYPYGQAATIDGNVGQFYHDYIYPYPGTYGAGASSNRFFPTVGNHDCCFPTPTPTGYDPYLAYFTLPGNERYYNYRYGPVEIFCLNSNPNDPDGWTYDSAQGAWLQSHLASSTAVWRLVYFHHPPYSSGALHGTATGQGYYMRWPFKEWGATAVLSGHDHIYERMLRDGMTYIVNGIGGDRIEIVPCRLALRLPVRAAPPVSPQPAAVGGLRHVAQAADRLLERGAADQVDLVLRHRPRREVDMRGREHGEDDAAA